MYKVKVIKNGVEKYGSTFTTEEEANTWIDSQVAKNSWGKKEVIMLVAEVLPPMELIEEVKGPMGIPAFKVRLPADYEVIIEEHTPELKDMSKELHRILRGTDWLFVADEPVDKNYRVEYKRYREVLRNKLESKVGHYETFEKWLRRTSPEHFLEGGKGQKMIDKFNIYLGE